MRPAAIGIIFDTNRERVLLVKRRDVPVWVLPGGGIDDRETPEQAVVREVYEETGLQVNVLSQSAEYSPINRFTSTTHIFLCQSTGGKILGGEESADVAYFPLDNLPRTLFPYHDEWLKEALCRDLEKPIRRPMSRATYWRIVRTYLSQPLVAIRYLITRLNS